MPGSTGPRTLSSMRAWSLHPDAARVARERVADARARTHEQLAGRPGNLVWQRGRVGHRVARSGWRRDRRRGLTVERGSWRWLDRRRTAHRAVPNARRRHDGARLDRSRSELRALVVARPHTSFVVARAVPAGNRLRPR